MAINQQQNGVAVTTIAIILACAATCFHGAAAHGGGLHRWTLNPNVTEVIKDAVIRPYYPNVMAAVAREWQILNTTEVSPAAYLLPFFSSKANITVKGTVEVYTYLSGNCTDSPQTSLVPFLHFEEHKSRHGKMRNTPYGKLDKVVFGYGFTGTCDAPGNLYRQNVTMEDNRFNLAWWGAEGVIGEGLNMTDLGKAGTLWGASPNSYMIRGPNQTDQGEVMNSIILVLQGGPTFCSPVEWVADPSSAYDFGINCSVPVLPP